MRWSHNISTEYLLLLCRLNGHGSRRYSNYQPQLRLDFHVVFGASNSINRKILPTLALHTSKWSSNKSQTTFFRKHSKSKRHFTLFFYFFSFKLCLEFSDTEDINYSDARLLHLKGNRPIKSTIEFLLKLHTVVECYLLSEEMNKNRVIVLHFEITQRHLYTCVDYVYVYSKDPFQKNRWPIVPK